MKIFKFSILLLFLTSCSTSFESTSKNVLLSVVANNLVINNQISEKIYNFAVESDIIALINWAPSTSGPFIEKGKSKKIPFSEIFNGSDEPVKTGDRIIIYWWNDALQEFNDVHSEVIVL